MLKLLLLTALLTLFLDFGCTSQRMSTPLSSPAAAVNPWIPSDSSISAEAEWDKTLKEAKKEGKLVVFTTTGPPVRKAISEVFKNRTNLEIEFMAGRGPEIIPRLFAERRAGLYLTDIYIGGSTPIVNMLKPEGVLAPLKPELFLPEVLDRQGWFQKKLPWLDNEEKFILIMIAQPAAAKEVAFNRNLFPKEQVSSYYDLLKPSFKGAINMQDPTISGKGLKWFQTALEVYPTIDVSFMKSLAKQEPVITRDKRLQIEWLAHGKHSISLLPDDATITEFMASGAPVETSSMKEAKPPRLATSSGSLALIKNAPHPYASKLFINWILSREGQYTFSKGYTSQSTRVDIPTEFLNPEDLRKQEEKYFWETEDFLKGEEEKAKLAREIFGHLVR